MRSLPGVHARLALVALTLSAGTLTACGGSPPATTDQDGGVQLPGDGGLVEDSAVPVDADLSTPHYGPCRVDADCPNEGAICDTIFPGGICSAHCVDDVGCGDGACVYGQCRPSCTAGANDCARYSAACYRPDFGLNYCQPECYPTTTPPEGWATCNPGLTCAAYGAYCYPTFTPQGADNGAPCTDSSQCRSELCISEAQVGSWIGGACASYGRQVAGTDFVPGGPLPQSNCPDGSRVFPSAWILRAATLGDLTYCLAHCTADTDCRPGYECMGLQDEGDGIVFSDGVCMPTDDCATPAHACPSGYTCRAGTCGR